MGWKQSVDPNFDQYKGAKPYMDLFYEFVASLLFILIGSNGTAAAGGALTWGIAFVVVRIVFSGSHVNSWITVYKIFTGNFDLLKGLCFLGCQFLGAFVAGHVAGGFDFKDDSITHFEIDNWKTGLYEFIALSIFLWCYLQAESGDTGDMNANIFLILAVAVTFFFNANTCFSYSRCFMSIDSIKNSWPYLVWGFAACVVTHVKRVLTSLESRWFFQE